MANKLLYVTSRDNPLLVRLRKLARHPGEYRKLHQVLLEGEHLCRAWAERGGARALHAVISESAWQGGRFLELADAAAATVIVTDAVMAEIGTLDAPAPIVFVVPLPTPPALDPNAPSVVLDQVQDAGNVGSILRSAAAFGFTQVIALQGTASLWSAKVLRAGMGAHLSLCLVENAADEVLTALTNPWLGTSSHASESLARAPLPWPCVWVFGNEGAGMSAALQARCTMSLKVPQPGGEESLNVAAAAAICLYESARRRAS
ncbi:MAG: RNA methyltransferase [Pseudomonadota bacterium]|nr:RNA methyltransferase [Pseudomonadota bacterium]